MNCVGDFVHSLIGHHVHINTEIQRCYVANMICHWIKLMAMIKIDPNGKYTGLNIDR